MNQVDHWKHVRRLEQDWQFEENADRGYDFAAAKQALYHYTCEKAFYEAWWGVACDLNAVPSHSHLTNV